VLLLIPRLLASLKVWALTDAAGSAYQSITSPKPRLLGSGESLGEIITRAGDRFSLRELCQI